MMCVLFCFTEQRQGSVLDRDSFVDIEEGELEDKVSRGLCTYKEYTSLSKSY